VSAAEINLQMAVVRRHVYIIFGSLLYIRLCNFYVRIP